MIWVSSLSWTEIVLILLFIIFYLLYIYRVVKIARSLNTSPRNIAYKTILRSVYFILLIIALLGPSFGETSKEIQAVGKDIMIAVDLSESMNAYDIPPTRLEKVKYELKNIIEEFNSDRIGLMIFSSESFVQCPLTYDQNALFLFVETLHSGLVPNTGTDFSPALRMALDKLEDSEGTSLSQKSKIILLISDGEDFGEESENFISQVKDRNIRMFTLGVGTRSGSKIRTRRGYKKDKEGNEVVTQLNENSLKKLATKTGGQYFEISDSKNDTERLINTIKNIEGELRDTRQIDASANKYYYFLAAALFLILLDGLTTLKTLSI